MSKVIRKILPAATVAELSKRAARIKAALQRSLVEVGRELTEAKDMQISHGQFTAWVQTECGMSARTAQLIMSAYRLCLKNENFSRLGRSALFILGAADVPASTIAAINRMIEAGDVPTYSDVRTLVRAAHRDRPNAVNLAIAVREESAKAQVVDLEVHRLMRPYRADLADLPALTERTQEFRGCVYVAEIAVMLNAILDAGQVYRLATMLRNAPTDATLDALADALDAI